MQQEHDADERDDGALLDQRALEGIDRTVDEVRTVVDRFDAHALRKARRDLDEPILDVANHGQRVFAKPLKHNAGNDLTFPVHLGDAATFVWRQFDSRHVLEQNRHATVALDDDLLQVRKALDVPASAHRELGFCKLDGASAYVHVAGAQGFANSCQRDTKRLQPPRVDDHAVLLDEAADARDFGNALRLRNAVADVPVLNGPQLGEILLLAANDILIDPSHYRRVRTQARRHPRRQPPRRRAEIFEHTRARPVEVGAVLKDDVDERNAEEREAAHDAGFWNAQHRRGQRISHLILDHLWRLTGILRVDDHLNIGEVGNGIERHARDCVDSGHGDEDRSEADQEGVARGPPDDRRNHFATSGW